jgi:hypothetical protein
MTMSVRDSLQSMGAAGRGLLTLALLCWAAMMASILTWFAREPAPGKEIHRVVLQSCSGGGAVILWILLAGLFVVGSTKQAVPGGVGALAWVMLPCCCVAAVLAIFLLYDPPRHWPLTVAAIAPLLTAGYLVYAFFPGTHRVSVSAAGLAMWGLVAALSAPVVFAFGPFLRAHGDGHISAEPGPERDRFYANERERYRAQALHELEQMDDETKLYELEVWLRPTSPVLQEALAIARRLPDRQADLINMLNANNDTALDLIARVDVQPTPELCQAARSWFRRKVGFREEVAQWGLGSMVDHGGLEGFSGLTWIATNCGCQAELDEIEACLRGQDQNDPHVQGLLADLAAFRKTIAGQSPPSQSTPTHPPEPNQ